MNRSEAAQLLGHCAAFDNRTVGKVDATAWGAALNDVPLDDDTFAAVARFYGTPADKPGDRLWIQPHNVRSHRLAIRKERLGDTLPAYDPPPAPETGAQFIARRRAQLDAVATGRIAGVSVGQLTGGPAREVAERLVGIGRTVPGEDDVSAIDAVRRAGPLGQDCPVCQAPIGRPCRRGPLGKERQTVHPPRAENARRAAAGLPPVGLAELQAAEEQRAEQVRAASRQALADHEARAAAAPRGDNPAEAEGEAS